MNFNRFIIITTLLILVSCSDNDEEIVIADKKLMSVEHIFYNYVYSDQPPTRIYTTNYRFYDNQIDVVNTKVSHYWYDEPERNYSIYEEAIFLYDSADRLIKVLEESYSEYSDETFSRTIEFAYFDTDKIKEIILKDSDENLISKYFFYHQNNTIQRNYEYYENGNIIFYYETILNVEANQKIYHQKSKGPIFEGSDPSLVNYHTSEVSFNDNGNVHQLISNESPFFEYEYSDVKIPSDLPKFNLPFFGYVPYNILTGQFDQIVESYNTNYITTKISLEPTNPYNTIYKHTLSKDNYPLKIEVFINNKIQSETIYTYE